MAGTDPSTVDVPAGPAGGNVIDLDEYQRELPPPGWGIVPRSKTSNHAIALVCNKSFVCGVMSLDTVHSFSTELKK